MIIDRSAKESNSVIKRRYQDMLKLHNKSFEDEIQKGEISLGESFAKIFSFLLVTDLTWKIV